MNALAAVDSAFLMETLDTGVEYKVTKTKEHGKNVILIHKPGIENVYVSVVEHKGIFKATVDLRGMQDGFGFNVAERLRRYHRDKYKNENESSVFIFEFRSPQQVLKFFQKHILSK